MYSGSDVWIAYWTTQEQNRILEWELRDALESNTTIQEYLPSPLASLLENITSDAVLTNETLAKQEEMDLHDHYFNL